MALLLTEFQLWGKRGNESHVWPMFRMISLKSCFSEESVFDEAEGGKGVSGLWLCSVSSQMHGVSVEVNTGCVMLCFSTRNQLTYVHV